MLNLDDYYLGVILAHPDYYQNEKRKRLINDVSFDPFISVPPVIAITVGIVTLLHKKKDIYYDEYNSRWENELSYRLKEANPLGITLAYVKPFKDCYHEDPTTYIEEEMEHNPEQLEDALFNHSYYIVHSKLKKKDTIVIAEDNPMNAVQYEYLKDLLGPEEFDHLWQKKLKK